MINLIILRVALVIDQTKTAQREVIKGVAQSEFDPFRIQTQMKIMYSNSTMVGTKKPRPSSGYLARPRLGILKNLYSGRPISTPTQEKKKRSKKSAVPRMEFRKKPDYADTAYREAVSRLRILLAESYTPIRRSYRDIDSAGEETDNQSIISVESKVSRPRRYYPPYYPPIISKKYYYPHFKTSLNTTTATIPDKNNDEPPKYENSSAPPEILSYLEQQDDYIDQLEKESRFCKSELSSLLSKVKEVINENEVLHEKQKTKFLKSVFDELEPDTETTETETEFKKKQSKSPSKKKKPTFEAPSIVFESRISELEAQLTQAKIDLRKAQEENESYKRKIADGTIILDGVGTESYKRQIENLQREKNQLQESVAKLENAITKLKYKENDSTDAVKRSLDAAEHAQYEKNAAEMEIRRLKDELERQHSKLRDAIADQSRRISEERGAVERRYTQQIEQLTTELGVQWETTNKLQMELDKQRRENGDLRRECAQKQALIDELKKDMQSKIITLQSDIGVTGAEKSALEQQISSLQLANERNERHYKQEIARLQAELQSLRQRSDRADADLIHSRRENLRLNEQLASLEKEMKLNAALSEESTRRPAHPADSIALPSPTQKKEDREELGSLIHDLESKHDERSHSAGNAQEYREKSEEPMTNQQSQEENHEPGKPTEQEHPQYQKELTDEPKVHNPEEQETPPVDTQQTIPEQSEVQYTEYDPNTEQQYDQQYASEDQYNQQQYDPNYQYDPNTGYQTGPNGEYITDPNQQYDQYSYENQHYQNDPNQDYPEGMVEQYQSDPNQQFAAETYDQNPDPNQQYTGDTVPVDSTQH
ncbi:serologically defined colon cancer antigen 8 homolog isoform X3 [Coccinella septempunctata]|uniref:serologically defined colon cancer antigen 8 homolog isoform X3 n=1 Tax=Coccinella septempunctata TaxID=41139 RepID=UPI001D08568A|nr:serologically defined colon cancer antigen 8 homolog isoform X3 [Coccinella septempunctata]